MTREEAASYFEEILKCADFVDASYIDCVKVEAIRTAFAALQAPELTADEIRMLRKVVQCANQLYTVIEKTVTTNKADELLQKLRRIETEDTEQ